MAGQLLRYPSQDKTARVTSYVPLREESQYFPNKFYYSKEEIVDHSPSRKDGIDYDKESELRKLYCSFLQELGIELKVPQVTIATALMLCHRFYMRHSHAKNDWQIISTVSMFLACKAEETPRWLTDVTVVAYKLIYRWDPSAPRRIRQKEVYDKQKELILTGERLLLSTVAFDLNIEHPYKSLVAALKRLDISHKELARVAWNFVNDWLRSELCLQYKPHYIAAGSMFLAAKYQKVKLPTEKGKVWWMEFDVSPKQLEEVIQRMLSLLEKNRTQALPPDHGDTIKSKPAAAKEKINIPHSAIAEPLIAQCMAREHKAAAGTHVKCVTTTNIQQSCIISGSSIVKSAVSSSPQSCIISGSNIVDNAGSGLTVDARRPLKSAASSSPQSCVLSSSNMSKCTENESASDYSVVGMKEKICCQASDCGSAASATEDSNPEQKPREHEKNSEAIYFEGGNRKIDVNRIKEALKRRRGGGTVNKKIAVAFDDEIDSEAWIERELENGIELKSASGVKRMKL